MAVEQQINFGGNQTWRAQSYVPKDEQEVLQILARHADTPIRAFGGRHSWSDVAATSERVYARLTSRGGSER